MNFSETSTAALVELVQLLLEVVRALLLELAQLDVGDAVAEVLRAHGVHADLLARDVEVLRLRPALADDGHGDLGARPAAHALDGVRQLHVLRGQSVDLHDPITSVQTGAIGRRAFDGRDDGQHVVLQRDLDAEPAEGAGRLDLHLLVGVGIEERAVRIQAPQRPLDRAVDQLLGGDLVDVLVLYDRQDLREEPELLVGGARVRALAGDRAAERERQHDEQGADHKRLLHGIPRVPDCFSSVVGATVRGSAACPDAAPRNRGAVPASRRHPPSRGCRRRARTACSTRCRGPG